MCRLWLTVCVLGKECYECEKKVCLLETGWEEKRGEEGKDKCGVGGAGEEEDGERERRRENLTLDPVHAGHG